MFNVWTFERKKALNDKIEKMKHDYIINEATRKSSSFFTLLKSLEKQEQLVLNYKKRVDNFVMQVQNLQNSSNQLDGRTSYSSQGYSS